MQTVFRVDSSTRIGTGHFHRCHSLANEILSDGGQCLFLYVYLHDSELAALNSSGHRALELKYTPSVEWDSTKLTNRSSLVTDADQLEDAKRSANLIDDFGADLVILDNYFLSQHWVDQIKSRCNSRFMILEDIGREWDQVDFVVNGNLGQAVNLAPFSEARALVGGRFALLSPVYRQMRDRGIRTASERKHISVFAGGSDSLNLTGLYLDGLRRTSFAERPIDIVVNDFHPTIGVLREIARKSPQIQIHVNTPSLSEIYSNSRLALGAGGVSAWERACLGVPSILTAVAPNQERVCESVADVGAGTYLGRLQDVGPDQVSSTLDSLVESVSKLDEMSLAGTLAVDGYGIKRICRLIASGLPKNLRLRNVQMTDADILYFWFSDPLSRANSNSSIMVSWTDHLAWLSSRIKSDPTNYFILEASGLPIGQIRFDLNEDALVLSYSIDPDFRGRGLGRLIVEMGVQEVRRGSDIEIRAKVKRSNSPSIHIFQSLGFDSTRQDDQEIYFVLP